MELNLETRKDCELNSESKRVLRGRNVSMASRWMRQDFVLAVFKLGRFCYCSYQKMSAWTVTSETVLQEVT